MTTKRDLLAGAIAAVLATSLPWGALAQPVYGPGASDNEIKIGMTAPLSGPASAYGIVAKAMEAYFRMVNEQGGVNGRKLNLIVYDDMYSPPATMQMTRRLIESDGVLFTLGSIGSPTQAAVQEYFNESRVPQVFVSADAERFADAANFPWTINLAPSYQIEGANYARHVLATNPQASIAILYQDDDAGRAAGSGFVEAIEQAGTATIVSQQTYMPTDPTVDSQIIAMQASGADTLYMHTVPRATALALRKAKALGWNPQKYVSYVGSNKTSAIDPAGADAAEGMITAAFRRYVDDPAWAEDEDIKAYWAWLETYAPEADTNDLTWSYGYDVAAAGVELLKLAGDDLTRENIRDLFANLKDFRTPLSWPGLTFNTTPDNYVGLTELQMLRFDGERYVPLDAENTGE